MAIATAGTGVADTMHLVLGMPYAVTTLFWLVVLAAVFYFWNRSEHTLDIHSITTNRREKFYWCVVFATFALGTAVGDFAATTLGLGYLASALLFCGVILIPWVGWRFLKWNSIFAFWFAYVITRPIGASFADYFSKGHQVSGANFGDWQTALVMTLVRGGPRRLHRAGPLRHPVARRGDRGRHLIGGRRRPQASPATIPKLAMRARSSSGVGGLWRFHSSCSPAK